MKKRKQIILDFEIDKLTNSIENSVSGELFDTVITQVPDSKQIKKLNGRSIGKLKLKTNQNWFLN